MLFAVNYCKCGKALRRMLIIIKLSENESSGFTKEYCPKCQKIEFTKEELVRWG